MPQLSPPAHIDYVYITGDKDAQDICKYLGEFDLLALDTETYANGKKGPSGYYAPTRKEKKLWISDPFINNVRLIQLRSRESDSFIFDLNKLGIAGRESLRRLLTRDNITFILHNAKFDYKMLAISLDARIPKVYDTMVATKCIGFATGDGAMTARGWGLKDICRDYLGIKLNKEEQASNWGATELTPSQLQYAADDLLHLFSLYDLFTKSIREEFNMSRGVELEMKVLPVVGDIEINGMAFDVAMYNKIQASAQTYLPILEERICKFIGWPMISTPIPVRLKTGRKSMPKPIDLKTGNSPLDSSTVMLKSLRSKGIPVNNLQGEHLEFFADEHAVIKDFIIYKDLVKQLSNNYLEWVHPVTGRIHGELDQMGTTTTRFVAKNPNTQQVSKFDVECPENMVEPDDEQYRDSKSGKVMLNYRYCFVASPGNLFLSLDYSSQEIRVMVALSRDPMLIKIHAQPDMVMHEGKMQKNAAADLYSMTAELMWGTTHGVTCWTARKMYHPTLGKSFRDVAKIIALGLNYGKTADGLSKDWGIEKTEAESLVKLFFQPYPVLKKYQDEQESRGMATSMCIFGLMGTDLVRYRMLKSARHADKGAAGRAAKNTPIQGQSGMMMKLALIMVDELFKKHGLQGRALITGSVHDEMLVEGPMEEREQLEALAGQGMKEAGDVFLRHVVECKYGIGVSTHWSKD